MQTSGDVLGGVCVSMARPPTDHTAKRLLIGSVFPVHVMTHMTFLGGIGTLHPCCLQTTPGRIPGNLVRDVAQVGGPHVCSHRASLEAHGCDGKLFIGKLTAFVVLET